MIARNLIIAALLTLLVSTAWAEDMDQSPAAPNEPESVQSAPLSGGRTPGNSVTLETLCRGQRSGDPMLKRLVTGEQGSSGPVEHVPVPTTAQPVH